MQKENKISASFWPVFWTQFWGAFNDNVFKNALIILITFKTVTLGKMGPDQMVALSGGLFILPFFLFSATAGVLSDKWSKSKLIVITKVWELLVMLMGAIGFYFENIPVLLLTLFFMGLQSTFFGPAKFSILPELLNEREMTKGNALVEMGTFLAILVGTILGGVLIGIDKVGALATGGAVIVIALLGIHQARRIPSVPALSPGLKLSLNPIMPTLEIIKMAHKIKSVWHSILGISWFWFLGAALLSIFPVYVKDVLGAQESVVTLFLAIFSIGVAAGSLICEKLSYERVELGLVPIGSIGISAFLLDLYFASNIGVDNHPRSLFEFFAVAGSMRILFDLAALSVFSGLFIVPLYTFIQGRTDATERSRVIAGNNILNAFFMVLASLMLMVLFHYKINPVQVLVILCCLNLIIAVFIYTIIPEFLWRLVCVLFGRMLYRLKVEERSQIPVQGAAVLVCNHVSFIDWLIIAAGVRRPIRFVMHYSFVKNPVMRFFLRGAKVIPIAGASENEVILEEAFKQIRSVLLDGEIVCIFPEGKITATGQVNRYKDGVLRIIQETPVVVYPMVLSGLWGSFFSRKDGPAMTKPFRRSPWSRVSLIIGEPVSPTNVSSAELEKWTKKQLGEESD